MTLSDKEITRYARQTILPEMGTEGQLRLKGAVVLVVGAGGLGVPVLQYLAAAGVGRLIITDHDRVNLSNIHRQVMYTEADIGRPKAEAAREKLLALNSDILVDAHIIKLDQANIERFIKDADLVVDGSDNFDTRYLVNDACVLYNRPLVFGAVNRMEGQVAVLNTTLDNGKRSPHYRDLFPEMPEPGAVLNCAESGVLGPVTGIVGSIMANEAVKIIAGIGHTLNGRMLFIDCNTLTFREIRIDTESSYPVSQLPEPVAFCLVDNRLIDWQEYDSAGQYLVDVRQPWEKEEQDEGGILIPLEELPQRFGELPDDKPVVFYCRTGLRSDQAVQLMARLCDRKDVYSIKGGLLAHPAGT